MTVMAIVIIVIVDALHGRRLMVLALLVRLRVQLLVMVVMTPTSTVMLRCAASIRCHLIGHLGTIIFTH